MKRVQVESPYSGDVKRNETYARRALHDCILRGEAPFASHLLYTQTGVLADDLPDERFLGIKAGFAWLEVAEASVVYWDYGISEGMMEGILLSEQLGKAIEYRRIGRNP